MRTDAGGRYGTVALGDFNGDGRRDVAVSHSINGGITPEKIRILAQGPGGTLTPGDDLDVAHNVGSLRAGDLNGDGLHRPRRPASTAGTWSTWVQTDGHLQYQRNFLNYATRYTTHGAGAGRLLRRRPARRGNGQLQRRRRGGAQRQPPRAPSTPWRRPASSTPAIGVGAPAARMGPGQTIRLQVAGAGGVPPAGATAVVLNVTVTEPTAGGVLTAWPAGAEPAAGVEPELRRRPDRAQPGRPSSSASTGKVDLFNDFGADPRDRRRRRLVRDQLRRRRGRYTPVTPARILDTRTGNGAVRQAGQSGTLSVSR